MPDENTDATQAVDSSTTEVVKAEATDSTPKAPQTQDLMEGLQAAIEKGHEAAVSSTAKEEGTKAEAKGEVKPEGVDTTAAKTEEGKQEDPAAEAKKEGEEAKGPIPYERFQEVNEKVKGYEEQLEQHQPYLEAQRSINDFCTRNEITNEEFGEALQLAAALKKDPARAYEILKPRLPQLQEVSGEKLSPEYQKMIDDGHDPELVKRVAKAEANKKFAEQQVSRTKEQAQQKAVQDHVVRMHTSLVNWTKGEQAKDPDFKEGGKKHSMFLRLATHEVQTKGAPDEGKLLGILKQIKQEVDQVFSQIQPAPHQNGKTTTLKTTAASTRGTSTRFKTVEEAAMAGHDAAVARR